MYLKLTRAIDGTVKVSGANNRQRAFETVWLILIDHTHRIHNHTDMNPRTGLHCLK